mmetsp:Transcript_17204/g.20259  ORF Transcript_17204/g.20259 Transcript_17204/m.20259 type:complete len:104 (-) Transcript_17204:1029-1340(-)
MKLFKRRGVGQNKHRVRLDDEDDEGFFSDEGGFSSDIQKLKIILFFSIEILFFFVFVNIIVYSIRKIIRFHLKGWKLKRSLSLMIAIVMILKMSSHQMKKLIV